ncbi:MAG: M56 family metallopeptidase, partial [Proteiniphilum sp.]|nr:M56 family metallopeptidase [Proteiniphilum sp.]
MNIALALFYLLYVIVFRKDTFLRLRRFFFLSVILFSLLYPFFAVSALSDAWPFRLTGFQEGAAAVFIGEPAMAVIMDEDVVAPAHIPWKEILFLSYMAITFVFVLRFSLQLLSIYRIRAKSEKQVVSGIPVYQLKNDVTPFSFFGLIFIHTGNHSEAELSHILLHEQTHVHQRHSIDIMLIESACLFSWWNPFVWLMKREMAMNLEYLADNGVLREGVDSREYQYHLLQLTYHETTVQIVNNFNVSQLKQRIMMMNKTKSPALKLVKYVLMLPLFFLFIAANSIYAAQNEAKTAAAHNLPEPPPEKKVAETDEVFILVDVLPEFPGGTEAMMRYLVDNIRYPVEAQKKGIQGRVICSFVIMKDGNINDINVVRGVDSLLDAEAVRVIRTMPKWKPGEQQGKIVNVKYTIPLVF